ncbi:hypothetical protein GW17_00023904 [Ensete ventricosum]|nr:hypothetical protein GW17_00023904 [Ensete ventricosum]
MASWVPLSPPHSRRASPCPPLPSLRHRRRYPYVGGGRRPSAGCPRAGAAPVASPQAAYPCGLTASEQSLAGAASGRARRRLPPL